jgi:Na+-driven multidrug efflux pump
VISQSVYLAFSILYFQLGKSVVKLRWKNLRLAFDLMPAVLGVGVSSMSMLVMVAVQQVIVFKTLAFHGNNDHIALMAVAFRILLFAIIPLAGIGQALQPIIGVNYGARNHRRVLAAFRTFTLIASAISGAVWLVFMIIPKVVLGWFFPDPDFAVWGARYFRMFLSVFFLMGININSIILFQALGKGAFAAAVALSKQAVLFIPLVLVLPLYLEAAGVWLAMPLADGLAFGVAIALLIVTWRRLGGGTSRFRTGSIDPARKAA